MDREYDDDGIDRKFEEHRKKNEHCLDLFQKDIEGLSDDTQYLHWQNADLFVNDFFYRYDIPGLSEGARSLSSFFDFFNDKCLWSNPTAVKRMGASIKKFYKSMYAHGEVGKDDLDLVISVLKENLPRWIQNSEGRVPCKDDRYFRDCPMTAETEEMRRLLGLFREYMKDDSADMYVEYAASFLTEYLPGERVYNIHDSVGCVDGFLRMTKFTDSAIIAAIHARVLRLFYSCMILNGEINMGEYAEAVASLHEYEKYISDPM